MDCKRGNCIFPALNTPPSLSSLRFFQWFCVEGHASPEAQAWHRHQFNTPLAKMSTDLCAADGPDVAARSIMWFGAQCPGFYKAQGTAQVEVVSLSHV